MGGDTNMEGTTITATPTQGALDRLEKLKASHQHLVSALGPQDPLALAALREVEQVEQQANGLGQAKDMHTLTEQVLRLEKEKKVLGEQYATWTTKTTVQEQELLDQVKVLQEGRAQYQQAWDQHQALLESAISACKAQAQARQPAQASSKYSSCPADHQSSQHQQQQRVPNVQPTQEMLGHLYSFFSTHCGFQPPSDPMEQSKQQAALSSFFSSLTHPSSAPASPPPQAGSAPAGVAPAPAAAAPITPAAEVVENGGKGITAVGKGISVDGKGGKAMVQAGPY